MVESDGTRETEQNDTTSIAQMLSNLLVDELRPNFDVYLPNRKFRKSSPCDPNFLLCSTRGNPPSSTKHEALESQPGGIPLKFCHVENGRVNFFFIIISRWWSFMFYPFFQKKCWMRGFNSR